MKTIASTVAIVTFGIALLGAGVALTTTSAEAGTTFPVGIDGVTGLGLDSSH